MLKDYPFLCVQCRHGYENVMEGADAVLGRIGTGGMEEFRRLKQSPGSGVLSVAVVPDGPTRILRITDENKKVLLRGCGLIMRYLYGCVL